ncbi:MAG: hypothetical protein KTR30_25850 [Saprospiraceae bacterium]|nr:hypothetical protein [Saprospiraceae bacterium]
MALYSDHDVVHIRAVATQCLAVIQEGNGGLTPKEVYLRYWYVPYHPKSLAEIGQEGRVRNV